MQLKDTELESLEVAFVRIIINHEFQSMRFNWRPGNKTKGPFTSFEVIHHSHGTIPQRKKSLSSFWAYVVIDYC